MGALLCHLAVGTCGKTKARSFRPSVMGINWRKARTNRKHASFQGETVPSIPINGNLILYPVVQTRNSYRTIRAIRVRAISAAGRSVQG